MGRRTIIVNTTRMLKRRLLCLLLVQVLRGARGMSDEEMLNHVHLAAAVKDYYRASSVFNVYNDKSSDMTIMPTMLRLSLQFSREHILVQSMRLSTVQCYLKYYKYRTLLPLYVVTLKTPLDLREFARFARDFEMSLNLWLVFVYKHDELLSYCAKPDRNLFNVRYDTKMLVKCENDSTVREWYALRDAVRVNDLASWSMDRGFVKVTNKTLWERRNSLDGIKLRIATVKESAFVTSELERKRGTMYGLFGSALRELAHVVNFTAELVAVEDMYGNFEPENGGRWSGVMGRLVAREIDIGVAEFGRSNDRLDVVDFTVPLLLSRMNLYLRQPNMSAIVWSTYVQVFDTRIWMSTLLLGLVCSVVISLMVARIERKRLLAAAADNWLYVWGIQCQQGLPEFPAATSLKIAFTSVTIASMVIYTSYSATLTSYLALFIPDLPFTSQKEFLIDKSYNLTAIRGSAYHDMIKRASDPPTMKMRKRLIKDLPNSMIEAIDQVCNERLVLLTNELFVDKMSERIPCPLVPITLGRLDSVAFALTKRSQYRGILNYYIENFRANGIIKVLMSRHLRKIDQTETIYSPVSFWSIVPLLTIYFSGVGLAIVIAMCEYLHRRCCCCCCCCCAKRSSVKWKFGKH